MHIGDGNMDRVKVFLKKFFRFLESIFNKKKFFFQGNSKYWSVTQHSRPKWLYTISGSGLI